MSADITSVVGGGGRLQGLVIRLFVFTQPFGGSCSSVISSTVPSEPSFSVCFCYNE